MEGKLEDEIILWPILCGRWIMYVNWIYLAQY